MATKSIGGKIVLDGASQYQKDLKGIQSNLKELRSEMKLANAQYADNQNGVEALTTKQDILQKEYDALGKKVDTYQKLLDSAKEAQSKAGDSIDSYKSKISDARKTLDEMKSSGSATDDELKAQQEIVDNLSARLDVATTSYDNASQKVSQYQSALNNAKTDQINMGDAVQANSKYLDEAKASSDGYATSIDKTGKSLEETDSKTKEFDKSLSGAVETMSTMLAASGIIVAADKIKSALLECVDASEKFETAMTKINTIAGLNSQGLADMSDKIKEASNSMGVSVGDLSEATYQAISAGVSVSNSVDFAEQSTQLAIGGFTDATTAVDILTTVLNAYGLSAENTTHIADDLVTTQNLGKTTVNELASSMGKIIPTASAYGVSIDQVSAAYAELTAKGIATAESTTYLNTMLNELGDAGSTVSGILQQKTGKTFGQLQSEGESLGDVMKVLYDSVGDNQEQFMGLWSSTEAAKGAFDIASDSGTKFNELLQAMTENSGAASTAFEQMQGTSERLDAKVTTAMENLKVSIGDDAKPALNDLKEGFLDIIDPMTDFIDKNPQIVLAIGGVALGLTTVAGGLAIATAAMAAFNAVTLAFPGTAIALAVAALAGAIVGLHADVSDANDELNALIDTSKALNDTTKTSMETRASDKASLDTQGETVKGLVSELEALQDKTSLTNDEQSRQQAIVDELNTALPDLGLTIDDNTGKLSQNNDELEKNTEALLENYEVVAAQKDLTDIASELYDAEKNLTDLQNQLAESQKNLTDVTNDNTGSLREHQDAIAEASGQYYGLQEQITATQGTIDSLNQEFSDAKQYVTDHTDALGDNTGALTENADTESESATTISQAEQEKQEAYQSSYESALSSIRGTTGLFTELEESSKTSLQSMEDALDKNNQAYKDYADNLSTAIEFAKTNPDYQGVVQAIADMGEEGASNLQAFVDGIDEDTGRATASLQGLKDQYEDYVGITDSIASMMADIDTGYTEGYEAINDTLQGAQDAQSEILSQSYNDQEAGAHTHSDNMVATTTNSVDDMANAVVSETPKVTLATNMLGTQTLTSLRTAFGIDEEYKSSSVFKNIGVLLDTSIASGITSGQGNVASALQACLQNAVDSLDISGIAGEVNKKLGEAIGG